MQLTKLKKGEQATVRSVEVDEKLKNRLKMCNLQVGKKIKCIRRAPFGGLMIECDGICLGIRKEVAEHIALSKVSMHV